MNPIFRVRISGKNAISLRGWTGSLLRRHEASVFIALVALCAVVAILSPYFLTMKNVFNVLRQFSLIAILAVGEAMIIITAGIDLSVGSLVGLMGIATGLLAGTHLPPLVVFLVVIVAGCLVGSINGLFITKVGITPFIATLGMLSVARGTSLLITGGLPIAVENPITFIGDGYIGPVPFSVIIMFVVAAAGQVFASRTLPGRNIYAVGNNERAARLSGIRIDAVKLMVYVIMGGLCGLSGMILSGMLSSAEPSAGTGYELDVIAAVVMGGARLAGGEGSIVGVVFGAALMGVLRNGFVLLGISAYWQVVAIGCIIIAAVSIDSIGTKRASV